jgi:hypothetical protein
MGVNDIKRIRDNHYCSIVCMITISMESVDLDGRVEHLSQYQSLINQFLFIISLWREIHTIE